MVAKPREQNLEFEAAERNLSPGMANQAWGLEDSATDFKETELTLGPPGESRDAGGKSGTKRGFCETLDLNLTGSNAKRNDPGAQSQQEACPTAKHPAAKAKLVGWPPVRALRKNAMRSDGCNYVKVAVDGAPYLRKVDLEMYSSYKHLSEALEDMFSCFTIRNYFNAGKLMDPVDGSEYVLAYEDRDGDWMMVGDIPWQIFARSCKRIRLMKSSETVDIEPITPPK
ncbi:hypothetical protein Nepgr_016112 [Nepenthes gracilis]|uniref:Auxin-responsive protein n=1 Tax=Nepenthes gracilis TaxID=150966 RepID=A0AAD3SPV8_NEPGR|nr:hypothetical protein Nepgr_016112 [Nepenthes gracilis]